MDSGSAKAGRNWAYQSRQFFYWSPKPASEGGEQTAQGEHHRLWGEGGWGGALLAPPKKAAGVRSGFVFSPSRSTRRKRRKLEAERHFVACKKKLPPGEPRACEMAGYEACEAQNGDLGKTGTRNSVPRWVWMFIHARNT